MDPITHSFKVISSHTGEEATFVLGYINKDREGDIQFWEFYPQADDVVTRPGTKVIVFNT